MQTNATSRALATAVWPQSTNRALRAVVLVLVGTAVLTISAKIKVPFFPVPMTLQTFAVLALGAAYGSELAVATVIAYLAEAAIGLPVLTNTPPEAASLLYFLGPTGGFLLAFVVGAAIVGFAADRGDGRSILRLAAAMALADVVIFVLGLIWLGAAVPKVGYTPALLAIGLYPFALSELLKIVLASLLIPAVWGAIGKKR